MALLVVSLAILLIFTWQTIAVRVGLNLGYVAFAKGIASANNDDCRGDPDFLANAERLGEISLQIHEESTIYEFLGNVYMWQGEATKALDAWRKTGYSPAHFISKGQRHSQQQRYRCALDLYTSLTSLWPESSLPWLYMAETFAAQAKYSEAIEVYDRAVALDNFEGGSVRVSDAYLGKGEALRALQAVNDAYQAFAVAVETSDFSTPGRESAALYRQGEMLLWMGRDSDAEALLEEAIELAPNNYHAYTLLGLLFSRQGDGTKAIRYWEKAIEIEPNYVWTYLYLAQMYAEVGDVALAEKYYNTVLQIAPGNQNAISGLSTLNE